MTIDLPMNNIQYPDDINAKRDLLLTKFAEEKLSPNLKTKLQLIAQSFYLFAEQITYENSLKTKALGVIMRDRLKNRTKNNGLLNG